MILSNPTTLQVFAKGAYVGEATPVTVVDMVDSSDDGGGAGQSVYLPEAVDIRRIEEDKDIPARKSTTGFNSEVRVIARTAGNTVASVVNRPSQSSFIG